MCVCVCVCREVHDCALEIILQMIDITKEQGTNNSSKKSHSQNSKSQSDAIKSHSQSKSKADASSKPSKPAGSILDLLTDTTSQHGSHVYDQHCAICSGKMKKPSSPPQSAQAADDRCVCVCVCV